MRNHTTTPRDIDLSSWRVRIEGSGVENLTDFTYDDLLGMEEVSVTTAIECAGNGRSFFDLFQGRKVEGTQWKLGAIGIAEWTGVRLRELLERAKVKPTAVDVMPSGLDSEVEDKGHARRPMPIQKAMNDETLLVYGMNGEDLPHDHGYPARVLVPGWLGIANIKSKGFIEVPPAITEKTMQYSTRCRQSVRVNLHRLYKNSYRINPLHTGLMVQHCGPKHQY